VNVSPAGGVTGIASKFAVTVTALAGIINVVTALFAFSKITLLFEAVHFWSVLPSGGVPAFMATVAPAT
jgi:hypothetical protein